MSFYLSEKAYNQIIGNTSKSKEESTPYLGIETTPAKPEQQGIMGDVVDSVQMGAWKGLSDLAHGLGAITGADWLHKAGDLAAKGADENMATMSDEMKAALNQSALDGEGKGIANIRWWAGNLGSILGQNLDTVLTLGFGKVATIGVKQAGKMLLKREAAEQVGKIAVEQAAKRGVPQKYLDMVGYTAIQTAMSGGSRYGQKRDEVMAMDNETLAKLPEFSNAYYEIADSDEGKDKTVEELYSLAKTRFADKVGQSAALNPTAIMTDIGVNAISGLGGGFKGLLSPAQTVKGGLVKGALIEGGTEAVQGVAEQYALNQAQKEYIDPNQDLTEGMQENAINGAILGSVFGGMMGGIDSHSHRRELNQQKRTILEHINTGDVEIDEKLRRYIDSINQRATDLADLVKMSQVQRWNNQGQAFREKQQQQAQRAQFESDFFGEEQAEAQAENIEPEFKPDSNLDRALDLHSILTQFRKNDFSRANEFIDTPIIFSDEQAKKDHVTEKALAEVRNIAQQYGINPQDGKAMRQWLEDYAEEVEKYRDNNKSASSENNVQFSENFSPDKEQMATEFKPQPMNLNEEAASELYTNSSIDSRNEMGETADTFELYPADVDSAGSVDAEKTTHFKPTLTRQEMGAASTDNVQQSNFQRNQQSQFQPMNQSRGATTSDLHANSPIRSRTETGAAGTFEIKPTDEQVGSNDPNLSTHFKPTRQRQDMGAVGTENIHQLYPQHNQEIQTIFDENQHSGNRLSLNESANSDFAKAVDGVVSGRVKGKFINMGTTPDVFKMIGLPDSAIFIKDDVIEKAIAQQLEKNILHHSHPHNITVEDLKKLPSQLNNPVAIFKSDKNSSNPNGYVVLTELIEKELGMDKPVIAALHVKQTPKGLEVINIASVHGRRKGQLQSAVEGEVLYWNRTKGYPLSDSVGLQLPRRFSDLDNLSASHTKTEADLSQYQSAKNNQQSQINPEIEQAHQILKQTFGNSAEHIDVITFSNPPEGVKHLLTSDVEGWFNPKTGKITIVADSIKATKSMSRKERLQFVAWHEMAHRGINVEFKEDYHSVMQEVGKNKMVSKIADAIQTQRQGTDDLSVTNRTVAIEEALAEIMAAQETGKWEELQQRYGVSFHKGQMKSARAWLEMTAERLRNFITKLFGHETVQRMSNQEVLNLVARIKQSAVKTEQVSSNSEIRFSLNENADSDFAKAVDTASQGGNIQGYIKVGTTPSVLKMIGLPDANVTIHGSTFKKVMRDKHNVTAETLKQLPKQINDPVAVMKSSTQQNGYVVLTELMENVNGVNKPVVAALHLKQTPQGIELINIASVYGRNNSQIQRGLENDLLYWNKKKGVNFLDNLTLQLRSPLSETNSTKGTTLIDTFGLQLPAYVSERSTLLSKNIKTEADLSQYQSENADVLFSRDEELTEERYNQAKSKGDLLEIASRLSNAEISSSSPLSETNDKRLLQILQDAQGESDQQIHSDNFKRWFGNSKVVDENGNPLVVYHGSNANFTIFDKSKIDIDNLGAGFYFSSEDIANSYANRRTQERGGKENTYAVYLKMEKPLDFRNVTHEQAVEANKQEFLSFGFDEAEAQRQAAELVDGFIADTKRFNEKTDFAIALPDNKSEGMQRFIKNEGIDGFIVPGKDKASGKDGVAYVVFEPHQIKSATNNNGDFSSENADIRFSRANTAQSALDLSKTAKAESDPSLWDDLKAKDYSSFKERFNRAVGKVDEWFADSLRPVNDWIDSMHLEDQTGNTSSRDHEKRRLKDAMYTAKGKRDALNSELEQAYLKPILSKIAALSKETKKSKHPIDELTMKRLVGNWISARYSIEKNIDLLNRDEKVMRDTKRLLDNAKQNGTSAEVRRLNEAYLKAKEQYDNRKADIYNTDYKNKGNRFKVGVAGGWSIPEAELIMSNTEKHISRSNLEYVADLVYDLNQSRLDIDRASGRYTEAEYQEYKANRHYVPLTGDPNADADVDIISGAGSNALNIARDKTLKGRTSSEAEDAIDAVWKLIGKSTTYAGFAEFKSRIDDLFETEVTLLKDKGYSDAEAREQATANLGISKRKMQGLTRSSDNVLIRKEGNDYYEYELPTQVMESLRNDNVEHANAFLKVISKPTGWYARGVTQWTVTFAPMNMLRDTWEKSEFIRVQKLYDKNNRLVDSKTMDKIGRDTIKNALTDKEVWNATKRLGFGQELRDSVPVERMLKQLLREGGISNYGTYLDKSEVDLIKKLRKENNPIASKLEKAGKILEGYNKTFDTVSALASYKALIENGIDPKQAAATTLELTNFRKTGSKMRGIKALYMFSQPTVMGAANLMRYLSTRKGQIRFIGYMAVMTSLYTVLRSMDDEDEGGNKMDQLGDITRYIPIPLGEGKYFKIPVGFGMAQMAWNFSTNIVKGAVGDISLTEAGANMLVHSLKTFSPVSPSEISAAKYPMEKIALTATPTILQPIMQNVVNRSAFGNKITTNYVRDDKLKAEQSKATTAQFWKDVAINLNDTMGIDMHPEQIKNLFDGYSSMLGSLKELNTVFVENPNREELGRKARTPFLNQFIGTTNEFAIQSRYYEASEEAGSVYKEYKSRKERNELGDWLDADKMKLIKFHEQEESVVKKARSEKANLTRALRSGKISAIAYENGIKRYNKDMSRVQAKMLHKYRIMEGLNTN